MLRRAFMQGSLFNVGFSPTQGRDDCCVWGIHQKSSPSGGALGHGYPDDSYWERVQSELASVGVFDEEFAGRAEAPAEGDEAPEEGEAPAAAAPPLSAAFEAALSLPSLSEEQRGALQRVRAADLGGIAVRAGADAASDEWTVLRLLSAWHAAHGDESGRIAAEQEARGQQLQEYVRQEREAMQS